MFKVSRLTLEQPSLMVFFDFGDDFEHIFVYWAWALYHDDVVVIPCDYIIILVSVIFYMTFIHIWGNYMRGRLKGDNDYIF